MGRVICSCGNCARRLGEVLDLWVAIGGSYISPVAEGADGWDVVPSGPAQGGDEQRLLDSCHLQGVACAGCRAVVGLRCVDTPVNHVLHGGQLLLPSSSVAITSPGDDNSVGITIQRTLERRIPSSSGIVTTDTPATMERRANNNNDAPGIGSQSFSGSQRADLDSALLESGFREAAGASQSQSIHAHVEREISLLKQTVSDMRLSLNQSCDYKAKERGREHRIRLSELHFAKPRLGRIREKPAGANGAMREENAAAKPAAKEIASLRAKFEQLRDRVFRGRAQRSPSEPFVPALKMWVSGAEILTIIV
ncbi:hypothetical protein GGS23DRAFT_611338 [Durotheca rogersii]|uniref:uncharacterized protein n=1 Tax=Durotheca rogersii TaxID=419775 RepID=UPI002220DEC8|nr:uncharacterized protein GGS23DRAFT_611338 [Durotheca rogersii]KAI5861754.1 hypothetical protein GGS23DRAFT_611338 [Durotheca rogersii]